MEQQEEISTDLIHSEESALFLMMPTDIIHFIMFHLELGDVLKLLSVCRMLKDLIEKRSNHFWYINYQVTSPFEWLHRLQFFNRIIQSEKRESSAQELGHMILRDMGIGLLISHKSKIAAHSFDAEGLWNKLTESDHNAIHFKHVNARNLYLRWRNGPFPEPSVSACQELQFCDFPKVYYLIRNTLKTQRSYQFSPQFKFPSRNPQLSIVRCFAPGKYVVTWRLAVDQNPALGNIHLRVYDLGTDGTPVISNTVITENELNVMRGKGWFLVTMKGPFQVRATFQILQKSVRIALEGDEKVSGVWVDWVRVVNKQNKVMSHFMKKELTTDLTIQKVQEESKRNRRK